MWTIVGLIIAAFLAIFAVGVIVVAGAIVSAANDPRVW